MDLQGVRKAYQVLAILGDPTFKLPPRGSQKITNGSPGSLKSLLSVGPGDFKGFKVKLKKIKTINGS